MTVLRTLAESDRFISQEVCRRVSAINPPASVSTVYRQLGFLADNGEINVIDAPSGRLFRAHP